MIEIKQGDALNGLKEDGLSIVAHGVNCMGKFASGFAAAVAKRYPQAREEYLDKHRKRGWELGEVQYSVVRKTNVGKGVIANCATQYTYGYEGRLYLEYDALEDCLKQVFNITRMCNGKLHMPWIGCGLAGGDKEKVTKIIEKVDLYYLNQVPCTIWELPK